MKKHIKSIVVLTAICALVSVLMAVTNYFTALIIEKNKLASANKALLVVFPDGKGFEEVDISKYDLPEGIRKAYSEESGGHVFEIETTGYKPGLVIMCGISADGTVTGATYLESAETNGAEKTYGDKLKGKTLSDIDGVDIVSGSTKTTEAYKKAVKDALGAKEVIGGGNVDFRTEEEIFNDNLSAALPEAEGKFTNYLITEQLSKDYSVYKADNGKGFVFVSGESFVATDVGGAVVSDAADDIKTAVEADAKKLIASSMTETDITKYENMPATVDKAYKTTSGNYVFKMHANGYSATNKYAQVKEPIYIDVAITKDVKIISCITASQKESDGYGAACGKPSYYEKFNGTDAQTYTKVDAINGATITTNAYMNAIKNAFEAVKILEGGK